MIIISRSAGSWREVLCCVIATLWYLLLNPFWVQAQWVEPDSLTSIYQLKQEFDDTTRPDSLGRKLIVAGIANVESGLLHEVYLQTYLQNDTTGISIFRYAIDAPISAGDSVVIKGQEQLYFGQPELLVTEYKVYPKDDNALKAVDIFRASKNPEKFAGMLVEGSGIIKEKGNRFNGKYLLIAPSDTSSRTAMIYVSNFHTLYQEFDFETPGIGDKISVTGVLGQYDPAFPESMTYMVFLRTPDDLSYADFPRQYLKIIGLILLALILITVAWTILLKRKVKQKTGELEKSVAEKKILLKEIHHRVKNNLAAISGILELQADTSNSKELQHALRESQTRIRSMLMVHQKLYKSDSLTDINMRKYLEELTASISKTFATETTKVDIRVKASSIELDRDIVIPLGLMVNELLINAFKHAFKNKDSGVIWIDLTKKSSIVTLKVEDNGVGMPEELYPEGSDSLGMVLIDIFTQQLNAERTIENTPGACFTFTFSANGE